MALKFNQQTNQWEDDQNTSASNAVGGQSYPMSPLDLQGDKFGALKGVLPDENTVVHTDEQYPNSPMGDNYEMPNILASLLSPQGIQRPLYNYGQSKEDNQKLGAELSLPSRKVEVDQKPEETEQPVEQKSLPSLAKKIQSAPEQKPQIAQPEQKETQSEQTKESSYQDLLSELTKAQQDKSDNEKGFAMLQAADRIGNALAGQGHLSYDASRLDYLKPLLSQNLNNVMQKQKFIGDQQEQELKGLNIQKAKQQMTDEKAKSDPGSDISKVTRMSIIDSLNKIGRKDLANMVSSKNMSNRQLEDVFGQYNLNNMLQQFDAAQARHQDLMLKQQAKNEDRQAKLDQKDADRLDKANKMITASIASSRGAFGKSANILRSAEAIETLVAQQPLKKIDSRQIQELARSLDGMLSQGAATITGTAHLIPRSMSGDQAKIAEYITNIPQGAGQQKFVEKMIETVAREKELAKTQIQRESQKMLSSYADIAKKHPEAWNLMLQQHGLPEDLFAKPTEAKKQETGYSSQQENGIKAVMDHNNISREEAIKALKEAGKL